MREDIVERNEPRACCRLDKDLTVRYTVCSRLHRASIHGCGWIVVRLTMLTRFVCEHTPRHFPSACEGRSMSRFAFSRRAAVLTIFGVALGVTLPAQAAPAPVAKKPKIEVVFCLDTTGSMGGLIEAAKQKIWAICNQIANGKPLPALKVGLVAYRDR